jgi:hypothetical protein
LQYLQFLHALQVPVLEHVAQVCAFALK